MPHRHVLKCERGIGEAKGVWVCPLSHRLAAQKNGRGMTASLKVNFQILIDMCGKTHMGG